MKYSLFFTIVAIFFFLSCSSDKDNDVYPDSGNDPDKDAVADNDSTEPQDTEDDDINDTAEEPDESDDNEDSDSTDADENDSDMTIIESDPCTPNPCVMENSDGNCTVIEETFVCGCSGDFYWNGIDCIADPCAADPCADVENSTGECGIENGKAVCKCEPSYYWKENKCIIVPVIVYVKSDASGLNDGSSWENAFTNFKTAMNSLGTDVSEEKWIWVAKGVYKPKNSVTGTTCEVSEKESYFSLKNNVSVFGGFSGNESDISERDWKTNETVFSGDTDNSGNISKCDVYHVFFNYDIDNSAVLDGVIIENGNADYYDLDTTDKHTRHGGGMNNWGNAAPVIRNVTFRNNSAQVNGGALSNSYESHPVIENCIFENNSAFKGGAFSSSYGSNPVIKNSIFRNNKTREGYGGAVASADSNAYFYNCTFADNESEDGGAAVIQEASSTIFDHCDFSGNTANRNGGAISIGSFSNPDILNCNFDSNLAISGGGAMEIYDGSEPFIVNSKFYGNEASKESRFSAGGAILVSDATPYIINSLFMNNTASAGGAISNRKGFSVLINCTVVFNTASGEIGTGGGMYNETFSEPSVINTIMWYNNALNYDPEISNEVSTPVINNSNISGIFPEGVWDESFGTDNGDNISTDPMFNDPQDGDFTLFEDSLSINAGDNTPFETGGIAESIIKDLLGKDRILDGVVDIGAYESGPFSE